MLKVLGVFVLGFHRERTTRGDWAWTTLCGLIEHFPKHGRCGAGALADTTAPSLEVIDLAQHRARYD